MNVKHFFLFANLSHVRFAAHTTTAKKAKSNDEGGGGGKEEKNFGHFSSTNNIFIWRREWLKHKTFLSVARATPAENKFEINLLLHISHSTAVYQGNHLPQLQIVRHLKLKRRRKKVFALTCGG